MNLTSEIAYLGYEPAGLTVHHPPKPSRVGLFFFA